MTPSFSLQASWARTAPMMWTHVVPVTAAVSPWSATDTCVSVTTSYYPDTSRQSCIRTQSPFFTTTIIVSICILFAAVAIGVVMQIRSNMQRWATPLAGHKHMVRSPVAGSGIGLIQRQTRRVSTVSSYPLYEDAS